MIRPSSLEIASTEPTIAKVMAAPYRRELIPNEDGTWFARIVEFRGCMTEGDTAEEALTNLDDAMREWLRTQIEDGDPIPPPAERISYSGKFMVRVSPLIHRELVECAARQEVSLNAFVSMTLARAIGETQQSMRVSANVSAALPLDNSIAVSQYLAFSQMKGSMQVASMMAQPLVDPAPTAYSLLPGVLARR